MINFREILKKHNLDSEENAEKIAEYVTKKSFNAENFAKEFNIPLEDAKVIIEVIVKATEFRKNLVGEKNGN